MQIVTEKEHTNDSRWHLNMIIDLREIPILYINMDKDIKRFHDMNLLFDYLVEDCGFKRENIYRIPGVRNPIKANGVSEAHLAAIEFSKQFDGPFLVLEDDVELTFLNSIVDVPDDANAVYLGNTQHGLGFNGAYPVYPEKPYNGITTNVVADVHSKNKDVYRVLSMSSAHAILYIDNVYRTIVENSCKWGIEQNTCHDTYLATVQRLAYVYAYNEPMFINKSCRWDSTFLLEQCFYDKDRPYVYDK